MNHPISKTIASLVLLLTAAAGHADGQGKATRHYLSLGTSLSVGIQPNPAGENRRTADGYADQLHDILAPEFRSLGLVKFGCPGETTSTMILGGSCDYETGSQLAEAVAFLEDQGNRVAVVTIDIGVNDILSAGCIDAATGVVDTLCLFGAFNTIGENLFVILTTLRAAAHEDTRIVGMNYYNTFLAAWLQGNQALATQSALLAAYFNQNVLGVIYQLFEIPVADVAAAFDSNNFSPTPFGIPQNVLNLCLYTWMCTPAPRGPNIHANESGYGVIAATFASEL